MASDGMCECGCNQPAPLAVRTDKKLGWVRGKPVRFINGHNRRKSPVQYVEEDRGYDGGPCWIWQRAKNNAGYGMMLDDNGRWSLAHRVFHERKHGPIPGGMELDHLCRQTDCCHEDHTEVVSHATNLQRGKNAKLTPKIVNEIRNAPRSISARELARRLGVSHTAVSNVREGRSWKYI